MAVSGVPEYDRGFLLPQNNAHLKTEGDRSAQFPWHAPQNEVLRKEGATVRATLLTQTEK